MINRKNREDLFVFLFYKFLIIFYFQSISDLEVILLSSNRLISSIWSGKTDIPD